MTARKWVFNVAANANNRLTINLEGESTNCLAKVASAVFGAYAGHIVLATHGEKRTRRTNTSILNTVTTLVNTQGRIRAKGDGQLSRDMPKWEVFQHRAIDDSPQRVHDVFH